MSSDKREVSLHFTEKQAKALSEWYVKNARDLQWRKDKDPYHIWVSEIMLQQTRVEAVREYYKRFMEALPTVEALANCPEDKYLKLWEGLGYYSRVRNLHAAAVQVMEEYEGEIPASYEKLRKLKGIGPYTAGAISSIAFDLKEPAVDGNVLRVLMRLNNCDLDIAKEDTKKQVEELIRDVLQSKNIKAGTLNQALMELGALVCVPNGAPHCGECPWKEECISYRESSWESIPVKTGKKPRRIEAMTVFVLQNQEGVCFHKRKSEGLLAGLYEFPNTEGHLGQEEALKYLESSGYSPIRIREIGTAKHIFSHVEWHMIGYQVYVEHLEETAEKKQDTFFVDVEYAKNEIAIPSAFRAFKDYIGISEEKR